MKCFDLVDKKILEYLAEKDKASESAVINETFGGFDISKEEYVHRLETLQDKDLIRYERPFGSGAFVYITEKGRSRIKPFLNRCFSYAQNHFLEILTLVITTISLILSIF